MATLSRRFRKRFLLLLIPLGVLATFLRQYLIIPPEPVFDGKALSWWLEQEDRSGITKLPAKDLRSLAPPAVRWLIYTAEHGRTPTREPQTRIMRWFQAARVRWLRAEINRYDERRQALYQLNKIRSDAAPAIPTLVRILRKDTDRYGVAAADALIQSGPESRAAVLRLFSKGSPAVRTCLIMNLPHQGATSEVNLEYLMVACRDPDLKLRSRALWNLRDHYIQTGYSIDISPAIPHAVELLAHRSEVPGRHVVDLLAAFGESAAPAIPHLLSLLDDPNAEVATAAKETLTAIDPRRTIAAPFAKVWLDSQRPDRRAAARSRLSRLGYSPDP